MSSTKKKTAEQRAALLEASRRRLASFGIVGEEAEWFLAALGLRPPPVAKAPTYDEVKDNVGADMRRWSLAGQIARRDREWASWRQGKEPTPDEPVPGRPGGVAATEPKTFDEETLQLMRELGWKL